MGWHTDSENPPTKGVNVAGAQGVHAEEPEALAHVPAGQLGHWEVGLEENVPGRQGSHDAAVTFA